VRFFASLYQKGDLEALMLVTVVAYKVAKYMSAYLGDNE